MHFLLVDLMMEKNGIRHRELVDKHRVLLNTLEEKHRNMYALISDMENTVKVNRPTKNGTKRACTSQTIGIVRKGKHSVLASKYRDTVGMFDIVSGMSIHNNVMYLVTCIDIVTQKNSYNDEILYDPETKNVKEVLYYENRKVGFMLNEKLYDAAMHNKHVHYATHLKTREGVCSFTYYGMFSVVFDGYDEKKQKLRRYKLTNL